MRTPPPARPLDQAWDQNHQFTVNHKALQTAADAAWDVVVVGAGAAGLVAAAAAAQRGRRTLLLEKNRKPGVKILISGGTRCNITHATDNRGIVAAFGPPGRFLHSALAALGVQDTIDLFESEGVATKVEETGKIFPASDKATDVLAALVRRLQRSGCTLALDEALCEIGPCDHGFQLRSAKREHRAAKLLITSGGQSYPGCGTIGEGFAWAQQFGHAIVAPRPALVPITTDLAWVRQLQGITIPDVAVCVVEIPDDDPGRANKARCLAERRGSFLFTHFGLSGPAVLDVSRAVSGHQRPQSLALACDLLPDTPSAALDELLRSQSVAQGKRQLVNVLPDRLPRRLIAAVLQASGLSPDQKVAELGSRGRARAVESFKQLFIPVSGTCGFKKAEVTAGGVTLDEVDSRTMQSKLVENLYWAGEVLDLDGPIGGYNFQAAWSTGFLAGQSV
jgi:predicted Rossmann fold flavoprotein